MSTWQPIDFDTITARGVGKDWVRVRTNVVYRVILYREDADEPVTYTPRPFPEPWVSVDVPGRWRVIFQPVLDV